MLVTDSFPGWGRHCDVKMPLVSEIRPVAVTIPGSRKLSTCGATSQLEHGNASWNIIVACMIVFVLLALRTWELATQTKGGGSRPWV